MTEFRPNRFETLPIVIKNLLIINGLFFLAQITIGKSGYINMEQLLGLHHVKSTYFQPWQLITHLFLHGGFLHIALNMFGLWMFGSTLETLWGPKRFLTFYLLCGLGAGIIQLASLWYEYNDLLNNFIALKNNPNIDKIIAFYKTYGLNHDTKSMNLLQTYYDNDGSPQATAAVVKNISYYTNEFISNPTIGASGAVFGCVAAFIYLFPNTSFIFIFLPIPVKAKWMGLYYFIYELWGAIANNPGDNVAHWAHIGGGIVGFLLVLTWNKKDRRNFY